MEYIRRKKSDTWHFMKECTLYPDSKKVSVVHRVTGDVMKGDLCNQCKAKAKRKAQIKQNAEQAKAIAKRISKGKDEENE